MDDATEDRGELAAAYEEAADRLTSSIERACRKAEDWPRGVRAAVEAALALLAAEPALGERLLLDPHESGMAAQARRQRAEARLEQLLRRGRAEAIPASLPETLEQSLLGGASFLVGRLLRSGMPERLPDLAGELTALLLSPYLGREEAERIAGS
jgi:hypothetical protein